jgi:hypothetical protein
MSKKTPSGRWLSILALAALTLTLVSLGVAFAMQAAMLLVERNPEFMLMQGAIMLSCLAGGTVAVLLYGLLGHALQGIGERQAMNDRLSRIESVLQAIHESDRRLVDLSQMSDAAKSLLFRQREIEAMNELLHEYLLNQQYDLAEGLANDVEKRLGYPEQVKRMRGEIATTRSSTSDQKIDESVDRVKKYLDTHEWSIARRMAQRLARSLPESPKILALPEMIRDAQARHKRDLLSAYGEAVKTGDVDKSIELLRELDKYLSPQEAAALEDSARGVFRAKLHNLGVQFAIRVTEEQWLDARNIGQQIMAEYPNSRMAQEVRTKMDTLQSLANGTTPAQV